MKSKVIILFLLLANTALFAQKKASSEVNLIVGTYTSGKSEGIYTFKFDLKTGNFKAVSLAKSIVNPSFLAVSNNGNFVYSVAEIEKEGAVYAYRLDKKTGVLSQIDKQPTAGAYLCHITLDKTGKYAIVSSYGGGNLSILPIQPDGTLGAPTQTIQHQGKGVNIARQESPHVHSATMSPDNKQVFVADLGIDQLKTYQLDLKTGKLLAANPPFTKVADGSGPRHFTFHPNGKFAYVIQELSSEVTVFDYKNGQLTAKQSVSTLPTDYKGENSCADVHISPDGKFLYGSNRIHDSIVIYGINQTTGELSYVGNEPTKGKKPRNFMIDPTGKFVLVANMETDNIVIFKRDAQTGKLTPTGQEIAVPTPVCLKMVKE